MYLVIGEPGKHVLDECRLPICAPTLLQGDHESLLEVVVDQFLLFADGVCQIAAHPLLEPTQRDRAPNDLSYKLFAFNGVIRRQRSLRLLLDAALDLVHPDAIED
jgi:hypothetical protein